MIKSKSKNFVLFCFTIKTFKIFMTYTQYGKSKNSPGDILEVRGKMSQKMSQNPVYF